MNVLTKRQILLLKFINDYEGFNGKINFQKFIFALQTFKIIDFNYHFTTGFYGPYCETLEEDINTLTGFGLIVEEPLGNMVRIKVNDELINKSFFTNFRIVQKYIQTNKKLEYKIINLFEYELKTSRAIELANSFIFLMLSKKKNDKVSIFKSIDRWKPNVFDDRIKEEVWNILVHNGVISEKGELKAPKNNTLIVGEDMGSHIKIENSMTNVLKTNADHIDYDEMLNIIYDDRFWEKFIKYTISKTECKFWDFKQTIEMWHTPKSLKQKNQIEFCEKIAAFANKKGGIIIIGISDKIPREVIGISEVEDKLQSLSTTINKWIDYDEDFYEIKEIILKDYNNFKRRCMGIVIAQTKQPVHVKNLNGLFSYPIRLETGLCRDQYPKLKKNKTRVSTTNFNFLSIFKKGFK